MNNRPFVKNPKRHWFAVTSMVMFRGKDGQSGAKHMTVMVGQEQRTLPMYVINQAQDAAAGQIRAMGGEVVSVDFVSAPYLGLMTEAEFYGPDPQGAVQAQSIEDVERLTGTTRSPFDA